MRQPADGGRRRSRAARADAQRRPRRVRSVGAGVHVLRAVGPAREPRVARGGPARRRQRARRDGRGVCRPRRRVLPLRLRRRGERDAGEREPAAVREPGVRGAAAGAGVVGAVAGASSGRAGAGDAERAGVHDVDGDVFCVRAVARARERARAARRAARGRDAGGGARRWVCGVRDRPPQVPLRHRGGGGGAGERDGARVHVARARCRLARSRRR